MEQRISCVTLGVGDLARARRFYEALGWSGANQPDDEVCFFQAGGMVFGLWTALGGHGAPGIELAHNVRTPEEVQALLEDADGRSNGSSFLSSADGISNETGATGLEPATSGVTGRRSNQLSYAPFGLRSVWQAARIFAVAQLFSPRSA